MGTDAVDPLALGIPQAGEPTISVIIPTLNEAKHLPQTLQALGDAAPLEVIVVDGGSTDGTQAIATSWPTQVITTEPGRAHQMNQGAAVATGEILLFLHADTRLPNGFDQLIRHTLSQPGVMAGAFDLAIDDLAWRLRWVEWGVRWRSRWLQMPYGDQGLFMKAAVFKALGGFPNWPLMEDFELVRQLRRRGQVAIAPATVLTSSRRWQKLGVWRTTAVNQAIVVGYFLGVSPTRLARWYRQWGRRQ